MSEAMTPSATRIGRPSLYGLGWTAAILGLITLARLIALAVHPLDLHPDEAQYWSWSRELDWGYFSKPPVIAWLIAAATTVCGTGEGCIKAPIPILYFLSSLAIYGIGRRLWDAAVGFFAALAFITLPGVAFSSSIASTDPPLITFWALALYALVRLTECRGGEGGFRWWLVLGASLGLGLLAKYAMSFFVVGLALWLVLDTDARARLGLPGRGERGLLAAALLALACYLPNLIWNFEAGFITFAHTGGNANLRGDLFNPAELGDFLLSQFGVFGPILFGALLMALARVSRWRADWRTRMLAAFVIPMLATITVLAFLSRANANWAAPAYVAATVWVSAALVTAGRRGRNLMLASLGLNGAVSLALLVGMMIHAGPGIYGGLRIPPTLDIYKHYDGWREMGAEVSALARRYPGAALLSDDRKTLAALLYYVRPRPAAIHAWAPPGTAITDHFKMTRPLPDMPGGDFLLITPNEAPRSILRRFGAHEAVATLTRPIGSGDERRIHVFHLEGFLGYVPPEAP